MTSRSNSVDRCFLMGAVRVPRATLAQDLSRTVPSLLAGVVVFRIVGGTDPEVTALPSFPDWMSTRTSLLYSSECTVVIVELKLWLLLDVSFLVAAST